MEADLVLCEECGTKLDAIASCCEALGEPVTLQVVLQELCSVCRLRLDDVVFEGEGAPRRPPISP